MSKLNLTGKIFGHLTVLQKLDNRDRHGHVLWECMCSCENKTKIIKTTSSLTFGTNQSCGCWLRKGNLRHGLFYTRAYTSWVSLIQRCTNPNNPNYKYYGGRGIKVCNSWRNSVEAFVADMGQPPTEKHTIDRINNDGDYERDYSQRRSKLTAWASTDSTDGI